MATYLNRLLGHMGWADQSVLSALHQAGESPPECLQLFAHLLGAEAVWLARLRQQPPAVAVWPELSLDECGALARTNRDGYGRFINALNDADLPRGIPYRNSAGRDFVSSIEDILLQVFLHGTYHRGQIASAMRRGGSIPAPTDYIGFIRGVPAATRTG
jgi:uncharacterized damage-inducible protein DinB